MYNTITLSNGNVNVAASTNSVISDHCDDSVKQLDIKKVIYNDPATIILWNDNTKTVVTCAYGDVYDPQRGFLLCCAKKLFGNTGYFNAVMDKHCPYESFENRLLLELLKLSRCDDLD